MNLKNVKHILFNFSKIALGKQDILKSKLLVISETFLILFSIRVINMTKFRYTNSKQFQNE